VMLSVFNDICIRANESLSSLSELLSLLLPSFVSVYKSSNHVGGKYCTMCGPNFCAMKISQTICDN
ncbi:MAG: hypothetical protein IJ961_00500, partial [Bacteroidales bacterium]|nr:hypothetical protein [Bacteroidales bacterium]